MGERSPLCSARSAYRGSRWRRCQTSSPGVQWMAIASPPWELLLGSRSPTGHANGSGIRLSLASSRSDRTAFSPSPRAGRLQVLLGARAVLPSHAMQLGRTAHSILYLGRATPDRSRKRPRDPNKLAKLVVDVAAGEAEALPVGAGKDPAVALGRKGGLKGGKARAEKPTDEVRTESARRAARARWGARRSEG